MHESKVVVITGVSRGIGRALVEVYAQAGYRVAGCARSAEFSAPGLTLYRACDIQVESDVLAFAAAVEAELGRVDLLIHNAGVLGPKGPLATMDADAWRMTVDVNLNGTFLVLKSFWRLLESSEPAPTVALMSSSVGRKGRGLWGAYSASKCGLEGLVDIAADELPEATVVSVNPGGTATEMRAEAYPDEDPATLPDAMKVASVIFELLREPENRARLNVRDALS